ncbi:MAG: M48 family metallopeptidase, partial [Lachnospiraceae bacterium]|nr:M48 family metallopeptidase [Candidatus Equihabitans merdae]
IRSDRRTLAIQINADGEIIVRAPKRMPMKQIMAFVNERSDWIDTHVIKMKAKRAVARRDGQDKLTEEECKELAKKARAVLSQKTAYYAQLIGVTYGRIAIRCQKTRWGSCSGAGNLNFNYLLMLAPEEVQDYVVVHELCHRLEMNHSKAFWNQVAKVLPDYKERRKWLKDHGSELSRRVEK